MKKSRKSAEPEEIMSAVIGLHFALDSKIITPRRAERYLRRRFGISLRAAEKLVDMLKTAIDAGRRDIH